MQKINKGPSHKKYFLSYEGHENIFWQRIINPFSTQPISG